MKPVNRMRPIHPGEILREFLKDKTDDDPALWMNIDDKDLNAILNETRIIKDDEFEGIARYTDTSVEFWKGLNEDYCVKTTTGIMFSEGDSPEDDELVSDHDNDGFGIWEEYKGTKVCDHTSNSSYKARDATKLIEAIHSQLNELSSILEDLTEE